MLTHDDVHHVGALALAQENQIKSEGRGMHHVRAEFVSMIMCLLYDQQQLR